MKTLKSTIEELEQKHLKEVEGEKKRFEAIEKTGIENVIYYTHSNGLGFGWSKPITSKEDVAKIIACYPVDTNKESHHVLKFASKDPIETDSSMVIKWQSEMNLYGYNAGEFKICYTSNGTEISIAVPYEYFKLHTYTNTKQGKHTGFGRYETRRFIFIDYFYTQNYSGGSCVLYFLEGAEKHEEYINFCITGEFKYANEL